MPFVTLVQVAMDDAQLLFDWVNRPDSLDASLKTTLPIQWDDHVNWLRLRLDDPATRMWIVVSGTDRVGQLRFQDYGVGPEVAIYIDERFRGQGLAQAALSKGLDMAATTWPSATVVARVKPVNRASAALFEASGFGLADRRPDQLIYQRKL